MWPIASSPHQHFRERKSSEFLIAPSLRGGVRKEDPQVLPVLTMGLEILGSLGKLPQAHQPFVKNSRVGRLCSYGPGPGPGPELEEEGAGQKEEARILVRSLHLLAM